MSAEFTSMTPAMTGLYGSAVVVIIAVVIIAVAAGILAPPVLSLISRHIL